MTPVFRSRCMALVWWVRSAAPPGIPKPLTGMPKGFLSTATSQSIQSTVRTPVAMRARWISSHLSQVKTSLGLGLGSGPGSGLGLANPNQLPLKPGEDLVRQVRLRLRLRLRFRLRRRLRVRAVNTSYDRRWPVRWAGQCEHEMPSGQPRASPKQRAPYRRRKHGGRVAT